MSKNDEVAGETVGVARVAALDQAEVSLLQSKSLIPDQKTVWDSFSTIKCDQ